MTEVIRSDAKHMRAAQTKESSTDHSRKVRGLFKVALAIVSIGLALNVLNYFLPSSSSRTALLIVTGFCYLAVLYLILGVWEMAKRVAWKEPETRP